MHLFALVKYRSDNPKLGDFWEDRNPDDFQTAKPNEEDKDKDEYITDSDGRQYQLRDVPSMGFQSYFPVKWEDENIGDTLFVKENENDKTPIELSFTRINQVSTSKENLMTKVDDFLFNHYTYNHPQGNFQFIQSYYMDPVPMYDKETKVWVNQEDINYDSYPINEKPEGVSVKEDYKLIGFKHSQANELYRDKSAFNTLEAYTAFYFIPVAPTSVIMVSATAPASRKDEIETVIDTVALNSEKIDWFAPSGTIPNFNKKEKIGNFSFYVDGFLEDTIKGGQYYYRFNDDPSSPLYTSTISVRRLKFNIEDESLLDPNNNVRVKTIPFSDKTDSPNFTLTEIGTDYNTNLSELSKKDIEIAGKKALHIIYKGNYKGHEKPSSLMKFPKPIFGQMVVIQDKKDIYVINATYPLPQTQYFKAYIQDMLKNAHFS